MRAGTSGGRVCVWCAAVRTVHGCGVWVHGMSINSVALRLANSSRCKRDSRGPVLIVRQSP